MIRKFTQCKSAKERLKVLSETKEQDWSEDAINTIIEILGIKTEKELSKEQKWSEILCHLLNTTFREKKELEGSVFKDVDEDTIDWKKIKDLGDLKAYLEVCENA